MSRSLPPGPSDPWPHAPDYCTHALITHSPQPACFLTRHTIPHLAPRPFAAGPSDPWPPAPDDLALYTAAELLCLLEGRRGVALLQLHVGWERHAATPPYGPYKPLVLRLLREALGRPDIVPYISVVPGGGGGGGAGAAGAGGGVGGLTAVLTADKEPFRSWGAHLASFGCQVRGAEAFALCYFGRAGVIRSSQVARTGFSPPVQATRAVVVWTWCWLTLHLLDFKRKA